MNRIDTTFEFLKKQNKIAFLGYLTAGDPTLQSTMEDILEMEKNGCDLIEIGIPFSDPCAEGPVIQQANIRALKNKISSEDVVQMVKEIRKIVQIPIVCLLYFNQIYQFGCEKFLDACVDCGIDGLILPDLPYEHQNELLPYAQKKGIHIISCVSSLSGKRKKEIVGNAQGFLYCMTSMDENKNPEQVNRELKAYIDELNSYTTLPKVIELDCASIEQIKEMKSYGDGLLIRSSIVQEIAKLTSGKSNTQEFGEYISTLTQACH